MTIPLWVAVLSVLTAIVVVAALILSDDENNGDGYGP